MTYTREELIEFAASITGLTVKYQESSPVDVIGQEGFDSVGNVLIRVASPHGNGLVDLWYAGPSAPLHHFKIVKNDDMFYKELATL